eukprot:490242-Rhodomonas_salina.1
MENESAWREHVTSHSETGFKKRGTPQLANKMEPVRGVPGELEIPMEELNVGHNPDLGTPRSRKNDVVEPPQASSWRDTWMRAEEAVREAYRPGERSYGARHFFSCLPLVACATGLVRKKFAMVIKLRLLKLVALLVNEFIGRVFLGWARGESRLLDYVGRETDDLFAMAYERPLSKAEHGNSSSDRPLIVWSSQVLTGNIISTCSNLALGTAVAHTCKRALPACVFVLRKMRPMDRVCGLATYPNVLARKVRSQKCHRGTIARRYRT